MKQVSTSYFLDLLPDELFEEFSLSYDPQGCNDQGRASEANPRVILHGNSRTVYGEGYLLVAMTGKSNRVEMISFDPKEKIYKPYMCLSEI